MSYLHAILGAAWIYLAFAAVATGVVRIGLRRRRRALDTPENFDSPGVFAALVLAAGFPLVWLLSAAIHIGAGEVSRACCQWIFQPGDWRYGVFVAGGVTLAVHQLYGVWRRWRARHGHHVPGESDRARRKLADVVEGEPALEAYADRVRVVECDARICAVRGWFRPTIEVAADLVDELDEPALRAALLHEVAHLSHGDPMRNFAGTFARVCNPFSRWLDEEFRAWRFAREIGCDRAAVEAGARPVDLAEAIVTSARSGAESARRACHLCGEADSALQARIQLLLATDTEPGHDCPGHGVRTFATASLAALFIPHLLDGPLLQLHCVIEHVLW